MNTKLSNFIVLDFDNIMCMGNIIHLKGTVYMKLYYDYF